MERATDWDGRWRLQAIDSRVIGQEERTPRWKQQQAFVRDELGSFDGLRVIEIGAGRGTNAALYAARGARVVLLDTSTVALEQARAMFGSLELEAEYVQADAFDLPSELRGSFDVAMSFGLCEHFLGDRRRAIVAAHLGLLRPGGVAFLSVPNRWAPVYRLWKGVLELTGSWPLGTEVPFTAGELRQLVSDAGGEPLKPIYGSFVASVVDALNQVSKKLGRSGVPVPQPRIRGLDHFAYDLTVPARRRT